VSERSIEVEVEKYGPFHRGAIAFIKELDKSNVVFSISQYGCLNFWNLQTDLHLSSFIIKGEVVCAASNKADSQLAVGSKQGVVRIIDISNVYEICTLQRLRLFKDKSIDFIAFNKANSLIAVASKASKKVFFIRTSREFSIIGYVKVPYTIHAFEWNYSEFQTIQAKGTLLFVIVDNLLLGIVPPSLDL